MKTTQKNHKFEKNSGSARRFENSVHRFVISNEFPTRKILVSPTSADVILKHRISPCDPQTKTNSIFINVYHQILTHLSAHSFNRLSVTKVTPVCPPEQNKIPCVSITKPKSHHLPRDTDCVSTRAK